LAGAGQGFTLEELRNIVSGTNKAEIGWLNGFAVCFQGFGDSGSFGNFFFEAFGVAATGFRRCCRG